MPNISMIFEEQKTMVFFTDMLPDIGRFGNSATMTLFKASFLLHLSKDNIDIRLNIRVRYRNRVLSFHLPKQIPKRSKLQIVRNICVSELSAVFLKN